MTRFINPKKLWTFARVPNWLMKRKDISPGAKLCYGRLSQFCDDQGRAAPGRERLADELAVGPASIDRYLAELIGGGVLVGKRRGQGNPTVYFFLEVPEIAPMETEPEMPIVNQDSTDPMNQDSTDVWSLESSNPMSPLKKEENKEDKKKRIEKEVVVIAGQEFTWPTPEALIALYNSEIADEISEVEVISPNRKKKAREYLARFPKLDFWRETFAETKRSRFLRGLNNSDGHDSFEGNFDWLLTKGRDGTENCVKTFEGRYRDKPHGTQERRDARR